VAYAGEGAAALVGAGDLAGRPFRDLVEPADLVGLPPRLRPGRERGEGGTWEVRFRASGRWASLSAADASGLSGPGADGDGPGPLGGHVLLFARDLGGDRVARDRLDLFRRALDATDNLVVVADATRPDQPVVFVNEHLLDATGYARGEVVGRDWRRLLRRPDGTEDGSAAARKLRRSVAAGEAVHVLVRSYTKGGRPFWNDLFVTPVRDGDGATAHFVAVFNDVTDRVEAEDDRAEMAAALEQTAAALVVTDADLDGGPTIRYVNRAFEEMTGWARDEVVGRTPGLMQGGLTDPSELGRIRAALEAGRPYRGEVTNVGKDGAPYVVQLDIAPVRDASGTVVRFVSTQHDVTARRRLEAEVLEAAGREQERMARELHDGVGQVLAGAAYYLHALAQDLAAEGSAHAGRAARVAEIVQDAQGQSRALARGLFPVALTGGLRAELARLAEETAAATGVACRLACPGPVAVEQPDRAADLYRIAQEAIANAVRHGRPQAVCVRLEPPRAERGGAPGDALALLAVEDDGVGIGAAGGGGAGLRTMRYRARRLGGSLEVAAREGGGTAVRVRFPLRAPVAPDGSAAPAEA
jgi:PAS domain S-box-containing protein